MLIVGVGIINIEIIVKNPKKDLIEEVKNISIIRRINIKNSSNSHCKKWSSLWRILNRTLIIMTRRKSTMEIIWIRDHRFILILATVEVAKYNSLYQHLSHNSYCLLLINITITTMIQEELHLVVMWGSSKSIKSQVIWDWVEAEVTQVACQECMSMPITSEVVLLEAIYLQGTWSHQAISRIRTL